MASPGTLTYSRFSIHLSACGRGREKRGGERGRKDQAGYKLANELKRARQLFSLQCVCKNALRLGDLSYAFYL